MKKLLLLFLGLTLISCSSDEDGDEDSDLRTTDPLIGTWDIISGLGDVESPTVTYAFNGVFVEDSPSLDAPIEGTWYNTRDNFNNLDQSYVFIYNEDESELILVNVLFNGDFSQAQLSSDSEDTTLTIKRKN